jgi:hypothetical protein
VESNRGWNIATACFAANSCPGAASCVELNWLTALG